MVKLNIKLSKQQFCALSNIFVKGVVRWGEMQVTLESVKNSVKLPSFLTLPLWVCTHRFYFLKHVIRTTVTAASSLKSSYTLALNSFP